MSASWVTVIGALLWGFLLGVIVCAMLRFRERPARVSADDPRCVTYLHGPEEVPHGDVPSMPAEAIRASWPGRGLKSEVR